MLNIHHFIILLAVIVCFSPVLGFAFDLEWINPQPQGMTLNAVWVAPGGHVFSVSDYSILTHDGSAWNIYSTADFFPSRNSQLADIWGTSESDVFAVTKSRRYLEAQVIHYDGVTWSSMAFPVSVKFLNEIWGFSSTDVYTVGGQVSDETQSVWHYNGTSWSDMMSGTGGECNSIWGSAPTDLYVAGCYYDYYLPPVATVYHYDGIAWTEVYRSSISERYVTVWGASSTDVFVGGGREILHFDGVTWNVNDDVWAREIFGTSDRDVFAVSGENLTFPNIFHYDGTTWTAVIDTDPFGLNGIHVVSSTEVLSAGFNGYIIRYDGSRWSDVSIHQDKLNTPLLDVWGSSDTDVYFTGYEGTVFHYNGTSLSLIPFPRRAFLYSIWGFSPSEIFVVSDQHSPTYWNEVYHYDGMSWSTIYSISGTPAIKDVWGISGSDLFAAAHISGPDKGTILHYDGATWSDMCSSGYPSFQCIWGFSSTDVYAFGRKSLFGEGDMYHYDGVTWTRMTMQPPGGNGIIELWGSISNSLYGVKLDRVVHYDGITWTTCISDYFYSIWGISDTDVFAAGNHCFVHYDGITWTNIDEGFPHYEIRGLWGCSPGNIFTAGDQAQIIHVSNGTGPTDVPVMKPCVLVIFIILFFCLDIYRQWPEF